MSKTLPERVAQLEVLIKEIAKDQKDIMENQKELLRFMDRWKFAGVILLGLGMFLSKVADWFLSGWQHLTDK